MKPLIALALVFIALPTFSQQNFSMSGSACHAITPAQADQLEWRTTGIKNMSLGSAYWVQCPVLKFGDAETFSVRVNFTNESNQSVDVDCNIREYKQGKKVNGSPGSVTIPPNSFSSEMVWSGGFQVDSHVNIACLLPAQVSVESVQSQSSSGSGGGGGSSGNAGLVRACITSPSQTAFSSDITVFMRNGMHLNNYDGRYWSTGDSHLTFETQEGRWHTVENEEDFFRLDVVREPDSCFEPDPDRIEGVERVEETAGRRQTCVY